MVRETAAIRRGEDQEPATSKDKVTAARYNGYANVQGRRVGGWRMWSATTHCSLTESRKKSHCKHARGVMAPRYEVLLWRTWTRVVRRSRIALNLSGKRFPRREASLWRAALAVNLAHGTRSAMNRIAMDALRVTAPMMRGLALACCTSCQRGGSIEHRECIASYALRGNGSLWRGLVLALRWRLPGVSMARWAR